MTTSGSAASGWATSRRPSLLAGRGVDTSVVRPACYSGAGFTDDLKAAEARGEVLLVDLARLYGGE